MQPKLLIAIDPGAEAGIAAFLRGELVDVGRISSKGRGLQKLVGLSTKVERWLANLPLQTWTYSELAIERPRIYDDTTTWAKASRNIDPDSILTLGITAGAFIGAACWSAVYDYRPSDWKGQVDKEVMCNRIYRDLSEPMKSRVDSIPKSFRNNALDAVGVGLYHLEQTLRST